MDYWKSYENIKIKLNSWSSQVVRSNVELKLICKGEKEPTPSPPPPKNPKDSYILTTVPH
jgi:hypothetical protein